MTTEEAIAAERAAIVRAIRAEADDYAAKANALALRAASLPTEDTRCIGQLHASAGALLRVAGVISQRETEDRP